MSDKDQQSSSFKWQRYAIAIFFITLLVYKIGKNDTIAVIYNIFQQCVIWVILVFAILAVIIYFAYIPIAVRRNMIRCHLIGFGFRIIPIVLCACVGWGVFNLSEITQKVIADPCLLLGLSLGTICSVCLLPIMYSDAFERSRIKKINKTVDTISVISTPVLWMGYYIFQIILSGESDEVSFWLSFLMILLLGMGCLMYALILNLPSAIFIGGDVCPHCNHFADHPKVTITEERISKKGNKINVNIVIRQCMKCGERVS